MTKIVEYQCNLCKLKKCVDEVHGLYLTSGETAELRVPQSCENHICDGCMKAVHKAVERHSEGKTHVAFCNLDRQNVN